MKVCPLCNRVFPKAAEVCEHDGQRLVRVRRDDTTDQAPVIDWEGPLAGDVIGTYRLESMLAEGGMGRIFRASHLTLGRRVAIKFLLPEHAARADLVQRFFNEARSINAIRHPHILEIYDFVQQRGPDGPSLVYMVMEHLEGEDLRIRLAREKRLAPQAVVHIGVQVAEALATAHDANIIHRDLKPDNIFLCQQPLDFVKVLDFGAAKAFGDRPGADLTRPGVAIGTPEYMAPEQILSRNVDGRVDAYALGVVLYELLTGDVPFSSPNIADVLAMHSRKEAPPMIERGVEVPPALEAIVQRCLEKDPAARHQDLWALREALRQAPLDSSWAQLEDAEKANWEDVTRGGPRVSPEADPISTGRTSSRSSNELKTREAGPWALQSVERAPPILDEQPPPEPPPEHLSDEAVLADFDVADPLTTAAKTSDSGMPTLDRRFSALVPTAQDTGEEFTPVTTIPVDEPSPATPPKGLFELLADETSQRSEEDDDELLFADLAPRRRSVGRQPWLWIGVAILLLGTIVVAAVLLFG